MNSNGAFVNGSPHDRFTILKVAPSDLGGGAERVARDLLSAFNNAGHSAYLAVGKKRGIDERVIAIPKRTHHTVWYRVCSAISKRLQRHAVRLPAITRFSEHIRALARPSLLFGLENFDYPGTWHIPSLCPRPPDIIHCHNLHGGYFDLRALPRLSHIAPLVITLHDAWLLTGHCAHSFDCDRWKTGCGQCPDLSIYPSIARDATRYNWHRKKRIYQRSRLHIATPCRWLMTRVYESMLLPAICDSRVIPNGVDHTIFYPADKHAARRRLGWGDFSHVIMFAANGITSNRWKDYDTLLQALRTISSHLSHLRLLCVAVGESHPPIRVGGVLITFLPFVADRQAMAQLYNAADVYVHPALIDTFPTTILEALSCGTPVVASDVGGISEQICSLADEFTSQCCRSYGSANATGIVVAARSASVLARALVLMLMNTDLRIQLGHNASRDAKCRFSLVTQAAAYIEWFRALVAGSHSHHGMCGTNASSERGAF